MLEIELIDGYKLLVPKNKPIAEVAEDIKAVNEIIRKRQNQEIKNLLEND